MSILVVRRVTITIDENIDSKIREIQAEQILDLNKNISYSQIIDQLLKQSLISQTSLDWFRIVKDSENSG